MVPIYSREILLFCNMRVTGYIPVMAKLITTLLTPSSTPLSKLTKHYEPIYKTCIEFSLKFSLSYDVSLVCLALFLKAW